MMRYDHPPYYLSAYAIACRHGFTGSEEEWLESLRGPQGVPGNVSFEELTEEQRESLRGPQGIPGEPGPQGEPGIQGEPGKDGEDGADAKNAVQIEKVWENASPTSAFQAQELLMDLSDGQWVAISQKLKMDQTGTRIQFCEVGRTMTMDVQLGSSGSIGSRSCVVGKDSIRFLSGYYNEEVNNNYVIPLAVYVIKGVT